MKNFFEIEKEEMQHGISSLTDLQVAITLKFYL
jgi:hypothetical protein